MELLQTLDRFLVENVKGVSVDAKAVLAHVIRPPSYNGVASSDRRTEGSAVPFRPGPPPGVNPYVLDVVAFEVALDNALKDVVAGYVAQLRQSGTDSVHQGMGIRQTFPPRWQAAVDAGCTDACGKREQTHDCHGHDGALTR